MDIPRVLSTALLITGCTPYIDPSEVDCATVNPRAITGLVEQSPRHAEAICGKGKCGCIVPAGDKLILVTTKYSYACLKHEVQHAICGDKHVGD